MRIVVKGATDVVLEGFDDPSWEVDIDSDEHVHFGPMHMFVASVGMCTGSVLASYADVIDVDLGALTIPMQWEYEDDPYRIGRLAMQVVWPGVPDNRRKAVEKAAKSCTLHHTLEHSPEVVTTVDAS